MATSSDCTAGVLKEPFESSTGLILISEDFRRVVTMNHGASRGSPPTN